MSDLHIEKDLEEMGIYPWDKKHPFHKLSPDDLKIALRYVPDGRRPDETLSPGGVEKPYLHRWNLYKDNKVGNFYFHMQVDHDPVTRGLHDHPWDNCSVLLAGHYIEWMMSVPLAEPIQDHPSLYKRLLRHRGEAIFRTANQAHRLELPAGMAYTLTQFMTGPKVRDWGFWCKNPDGTLRWVINYDLVRWVGTTKVCVQDGGKL